MTKRKSIPQSGEGRSDMTDDKKNEGTSSGSDGPKFAGTPLEKRSTKKQTWEIRVVPSKKATQLNGDIHDRVTEPVKGSEPPPADKLGGDESQIHSSWDSVKAKLEQSKDEDSDENSVDIPDDAPVDQSASGTLNIGVDAQEELREQAAQTSEPAPDSNEEFERGLDALRDESQDEPNEKLRIETDEDNDSGVEYEGSKPHKFPQDLILERAKDSQGRDIYIGHIPRTNKFFVVHVSVKTYGPYDRACDLCVINDLPAFRAEKDDHWFIVYDGSEGKWYKKIGDVIFDVDGKPLYKAQDGNDDWYVVHGTIPSKSYSEIGPVIYDGQEDFAYTARLNADWYVVENYTQSMPYAEILNPLRFNNDTYFGK
ncbi:hypothetical protein KKE33_01175, partial [Patescibacteria group bacterium]|nr:hypothetical protein [Patescibacteria group bacterium]